MEQLLEINYVPISFEINIHKARLEAFSDFDLHHSVIDSQYLTPYTTKLRYDTKEFKSKSKTNCTTEFYNFNNCNFKNNVLSSDNSTTNIKKEENSTMNTKNNYDTLHDFAFKHVDSSMKSAIGVPLFPMNFNWNSEQLSNQYEIDRQNYDWLSQNKPKLKFTPAKVEFLVKEYAHVEFKFLGKAQYVPPSASPDYVPPELDVSA